MAGVIKYLWQKVTYHGGWEGISFNNVLPFTLKFILPHFIWNTNLASLPNFFLIFYITFSGTVSIYPTTVLHELCRASARDSPWYLSGTFTCNSITAKPVHSSFWWVSYFLVKWSVITQLQFYMRAVVIGLLWAANWHFAVSLREHTMALLP